MTKEPLATQDDDATRRYLRGSSLLLAGRVFALATNFLVQVLTVRYLVKSDYGAFAFALSAVSIASSINLLGLQRAINRFVPIYHQRGDYGSMLGTIVLASTSIVGLGCAIVVLTFGLSGFLTDTVVTDPLSVGLLLIVIAVAPMEALDSLFLGVVAALASPRAVFFRRHVLGPSLRLAAVLFVLAVGGSVRLLAVSYLVAGILGVLLYVAIVWRLLSREGWLRYLRAGRLRLPGREIFGFSIPLMTTDFILIFKTAIAVVFLEHFHGTAEVADFRAVVPVAGLNLVVLQSLKLLYTPSAARLYAKGDRPGISALYWQTAVWTTVVTFPVFAVCLTLAEPVTVTLFGARYAATEGSSASSVLVVLAVGNYFNAVLGLNTYTLQVYARVRYITLISLVTMLAALTLNLCLIPRFGAAGAAVATASTVVVQNVLYHTGLAWRTDVDVFWWRGWSVYPKVLLATAALVLVHALLEPSTVTSIVLVALVSVVLVRWNRRLLRLGETFPEISRLPLVRSFFGVERDR